MNPRHTRYTLNHENLFGGQLSAIQRYGPPDGRSSQRLQHGAQLILRTVATASVLWDNRHAYECA